MIHGNALRKSKLARHVPALLVALSAGIALTVAERGGLLGTQSATRPSAFEVVTAPRDGDPDRIADLQRRLRAHPEHVAELETLGWARVEHAQATRDSGLYHLALAAALAMEDAGVGRDAADLLRARALHGLHRFAEAEPIARRLARERGLAFDHGLYGDLLLDRGRIMEAAASYQKMMDLRPEASAYARAARVRFLTGDADGAMAALELAARAVSPRTPARFAWVLAELALAQLRANDAPSALASIERALAVAPDALAAREVEARIALADDRFVAAARTLEKVAERSPSPDVLWALAEAWRAAGREAEARATEARLEREGPRRDARSFALWLAHGDRDSARARSLAAAELAARPDPYSWDAFAWACFAAGDLDEARTASERALASGTPEPRFHFHAAAIAARAGDRERADHHIDRARRQRRLLLPSERAALATLAGPGVPDGTSVGWTTQPQDTSPAGTGGSS